MPSSGSRFAHALTPKQYSLLLTLILYTSGLTFLMHRSRQATTGDRLYSIPASIFLAELLKLIVSLLMAYSAIIKHPHSTKNRYNSVEDEEDALALDDQHQRNTNKTGEKRNQGSSLDDEDEDDRRSIRNPSLLAFHSLIDVVLAKDCWKLGVPAALYVAQSNLQLLSIGVVGPVVYQAVTQTKLLATTLLSRFLLARRYTRHQYISLCVLLLGVIMVSISKIKNNGKGQEEEQAAIMAKMLGVMGVLLACSLGSGGAVYMEKVLKSDKKTSLWIRNAQLSLFSLIPATISLIYDQMIRGSWSPLQSFTSWAWITVVMRSIGGFLIALILQQTDSILKGIGTSIAMVLSILIESITLDIPISINFALGSAIVVISSISYIKGGLPN